MRAICYCVLLACLWTSIASAQTSVGFAEPDDVQALLDYRLPDWGYRTWHGGVDLRGAGDGGPETQNSIALNLNTDFGLYRESEDRVLELHSSLSTSFSSRQDEAGYNGDDYRRSLNSVVRVGGDGRHYFREGIALLTSMKLESGYQEQKTENDLVDNLTVVREFSITPGVGVSFGRLRNVIPLLRARRLSERLQALGRPALSASEVRRLAAILAQHDGYVTVFDRPDKEFWGDLLGDLADERPLSPYEVLYLVEALQENLGDRNEGTRLDLAANVRRQSASGSYASGRTRLGASVSFRHSHNLNLEHQLSASGFGDWFRTDWTNDRRDEIRSALSLSHQWILADRIVWTNSVRGSLTYSELEQTGRIGRSWNNELASSMNFHIEDSVTLHPSVSLGYQSREVTGRAEESDIIWQFGFSVDYLFDGMMI